MSIQSCDETFGYIRICQFGNFSIWESTAHLFHVASAIDSWISGRIMLKLNLKYLFGMNKIWHHDKTDDTNLYDSAKVYFHGRREQKFTNKIGELQNKYEK